MRLRHVTHRHSPVTRMMILGGFFVAVCLVYLVRLGMLELNGENIGGNRQDGTTQRTVIIQAVRGQIYDRNGKPLVTNRYTYDLTVDYSVFPTDTDARNDALLDILHTLGEQGEGDTLVSYDPPFDGIYPDLTYTAAATDPSTAAYKTLVSQIKTSGLRSTMINKLRHDGMTNKAAEEAFDADPLRYVDAAVLVDYFVKEYGLTGRYSTMEVHRLIRIYWGMEVSGFSRANDYVLATDVSMETITHVKEKGIPGMGFATNAERVYVYPGYASHILGQTGPIYAEEWETYKALGYNMNALVGKSGCEAAFEAYLHGQDGIKVVVEDADGRVVDEYIKTQPVAGKDVYLTIDIDLQIAAEDGLAENVAYIRENLGREECKAGALTAVDPNTGEILAIASYPTYDLTTFNADYSDLMANEGLPLLNRALNGVYAPGSTFKPGMVAAALMEGVVSPTTRLECAGTYTYYDSYQPDCWVYNSTSDDISEHGWINAAEALEVSCNCYFYEAGRLLGIEDMNDYCRRFGLGEKTGIELGESTGVLAGPAWRELSHQRTWQPTDTIAAAIGQSDNAFTPLQLGMYISTLVNGGTRYSAHLLSRVRDVSTREDVEVTSPKVLDEFNLHEPYRLEIIDGMERVVSSSGSISRWMSRVPVTVAGKTGTAQVGGGETDNGLFVCCAPSTTPEIVVSAVIERCGGGSYAALAASRVLEAYYAE